VVNKNKKPQITFSDDIESYQYKGIYEEETNALLRKNWSAIRTYNRKGKCCSVYNRLIKDNNIISTLNNKEVK